METVTVFVRITMGNMKTTKATLLLLATTKSKAQRYVRKSDIKRIQFFKCVILVYYIKAFADVGRQMKI